MYTPLVMYGTCNSRTQEVFHLNLLTCVVVAEEKKKYGTKTISEWCILISYATQGPTRIPHNFEYRFWQRCLHQHLLLFYFLFVCHRVYLNKAFELHFIFVQYTNINLKILNINLIFWFVIIISFWYHK